MAMNGILNLHFLMILTNTLEETIAFSKKMGIIPPMVKCLNCQRILDKPYILKKSNCDTSDIRYQCNKKACRARGKKNVVSLKTVALFT